MTPNPLQIRAKSAQIERAEKGFHPRSRSNRNRNLNRRCEVAFHNYTDSWAVFKTGQTVNMGVAP